MEYVGFFDFDLKSPKSVKPSKSAFLGVEYELMLGCLSEQVGESGSI